RYTMFKLEVNYCTMRAANGNSITMVDEPHECKKCFLHENLEEEVYMKLPPRHPQSSYSSLVCELHKSTYDLMQSPCTWHAKLSVVLFQELSFLRSVADSSNHAISQLKHTLQSRFLLKDLDHLNYFSTLTPLDSKLKLASAGAPLQAINDYQELVGKLIYLIITQLITYALSIVIQLMHALSSASCDTLKGSIGRGIVLTKNSHTQITGYNEYHVMASIACEIIWLKVVYQSHYAYHSQSHIEVYCHFISQQIIQTTILEVIINLLMCSLRYCPTHNLFVYYPSLDQSIPLIQLEGDYWRKVIK
ncbi:hypothetical protein CR513_62461, partial [Mucuna pruriens]